MTIMILGIVVSVYIGYFIMKDYMTTFLFAAWD